MSIPQEPEALSPRPSPSRQHRRSRLSVGTKRAVLETLLEIAVPIAIVVAWALWSSQAGSFFFPPLTDIFQEFSDTWLFERIKSDVVPSLGRLGLGYVIAVVLGISVGIPLGLLAVARRAASPIIEFLRAIPAPALIPFLLVVLGLGTEVKVFVIAFGCLWPVLLGTIDGITGVDSTMADTASVYRVRGVERIQRVVIPAASPQIFAAMRQSLSLALILMVVSEMVASTNGIGYFVLQSQRNFAIPEMWSGILLIGLLGYLLNTVFVFIERRVLAWHRGARASALG